jgi:ectoine hydroxylase-related dioxygenase (phytanoyl-CoA dioxygenase family)
MSDPLQRYREDGYVVLERVIEPDLIAELKAALARLEREGGFGFAETAFEGRRTVRIYNLLAHGEIFQRVPLHPGVLPVAEAILDEGLQLSSLSAITLAPGETAQTVHADSQLIPLPRPHPAIAVNALWALSDFTEANGATRVVPGSHLHDHAPEYGEPYDTIAAEMPVGSVMLFDSQLWHGGGANRTADRRWAVACYYCAGWVRQQENQQLGLPRELVAGFPRRLQELCGWSVYKGLYGHVDNRDPIEQLDRAPKAQMVWQASERAARKRTPDT